MAIRRELFKGEVLYRQGEVADCAWAVERGSVELSSRAGTEVHSLGEFGVNELIGELAALDGSPYSSTAIAHEDCTLLQIDRGQFQQRIDESDVVVRSLLQSLLDYKRSVLARLPEEVAAPAEDVACDDPVERAGVDKVRLESRLRDALDSRTLEVRYQPIYDVVERRVAGYEALVRWELPGRGPVSPAEFIAIAEETSLIVPVGEYVLERVIEVLTGLLSSDLEVCPSIAVNLSGRHLVEPGVAAHILARARDAALPAGVLKLEVTESRTLDYAKVAGMMRRCRDAGIPFALDDFGTGYSNLSHLQELDFEYVKVDQAFVRRMFDNDRALALVRAIIAMVQSVGAACICEGVETREQLHTLSDLGMRYAQGYLTGKAAPAAEVLSGETVRRAAAAVAEAAGS